MEHANDVSMHQDVPAATLDSFEIEDINDLDSTAAFSLCSSSSSCFLCACIAA